MTTTYEEACRVQATAQGLDPIMEALAAKHVTYTLEQTGGFVMVVTVALPVGDTLVITHESTTTGGDDYTIGRYEDWTSGEDEGTFVEGYATDDAVAYILDAGGVTIVARPYEACQCPECGEWVYAAAGPFAEGDRTKPLAAWLHWQRYHLTADEAAQTVIGFPYFRFNDQAIESVLEVR
jgi:hypothetical protein